MRSVDWNMFLALIIRHRVVKGHGGPDEGLERLSINIVAFTNIDGAPGVARHAGVEGAGRILEGSALSEGQLDVVLICFTGTDYAVV